MFFGRSSNTLKARIKELEEENNRLREALKFYADPKNWSEGHKYRDADDATIFQDSGETSASVDMGAIALRALKKK